MLSKLKKSDNKGFTIIEVMIVLAIAGLVILIVLLAVPALQRNGRNTANKNDASSVAGGISEYRSNNDGANPTSVTGTGTVVIAGGGTTTSATVTIQPTTQANNAGGNAVQDRVVVTLGSNCAGTASNRAAAVRYWTEQAGGGIGTKCIDA